jgi:hypothetical protein
MARRQRFGSTAPARKRNTFTKQHGSTYTCDTCGRETRNTGAQSMGSKLCPDCFDLCGIDNEISDGHATIEERRADIDALIAKIESKGTLHDSFTHLLRSANCPKCSKNGTGGLCDTHHEAALDDAIGVVSSADLANKLQIPIVVRVDADGVVDVTTPDDKPVISMAAPATMRDVALIDVVRGLRALGMDAYAIAGRLAVLDVSQQDSRAAMAGWTSGTQQQYRYTEPELPRGITITSKGYRAAVRVSGTLKTKRFPFGTSLIAMITWRDAAKQQLAGGAQ